MANTPRSNKRVQVDKAKSMLLGIVAGASVLSVFALVASKTYFSQASYLNKVAGEKEKALNQLKANKEAVGTLVASYKTFAASTPNLLSGSPTGKGEKDGDNARLVLDALPSKYDFPAMTTSLEKLLTGYSINSITGVDDATLQDQAASAPAPIDMPFTLNVGTDYKGMKGLVETFERSIRPFQILTLDITGSNKNLQATIGAKTFYQPEKDLKITTKVVK